MQIPLLQTLTEDLKRKFAVDGEPLLDEHSFGSLGRSPPPAEFLKKIAGFDTPDSSRASWSAAAHRDNGVLDVDEALAPGRGYTPVLQPATAPAPQHTPTMPVQIQRQPCTADDVGAVPSRGLPPLFADTNGSTRAASMPGHQPNGLLSSAIHGGYAARTPPTADERCVICIGGVCLGVYCRCSSSFLSGVYVPRVCVYCDEYPFM